MRWLRCGGDLDRVQAASVCAWAADEIERLRELVRRVADEPSLDGERAMADAELYGNAELNGRRGG